ncbi:MAG TPA: NADPH-dependent FMN reductase [Thermoanaerobaculia bacterium]
MLHILAIAGSLRRGSYNRLLLRAAAGVSIYEELSSIPLFNEDLEASDPESVCRLREAVASADGLLISTPEYNWSIPGMLKNAIDWLSRPPAEVLIGKPVAIIGASAGRWGTRLAQAALRQTLTATESLVMPAPAMFVRDASEIFDEAGRLTNKTVRDQLDGVLATFDRWISLVRR